MKRIDAILNQITMYKLVVFSLALELLWGIIAMSVGLIDHSATGLILTIVVAVIACWITNSILSRLYHAPTNVESWLITALILALILPQITTPHRLAAIGLASGLAIASKYVLGYRFQHIFNPAAFGATFIGLIGLGYTTWWVGTPVMAPLTIVLGLAVIRKIRRFELLVTFLLASLITSVIVVLSQGEAIGPLLSGIVFSSPLIFLGTIMLTEPSTMPSGRAYRNDFALIVGVLSSLQLSFGRVTLTAELALLAGNIFAFAISRRPKYLLKLKERITLTPSVVDYVFTTPVPVVFTAGQYMEWTLPHRRPDFRGNRRSFTLASAPQEDEIHLGVRVADARSSFKKALAAMEIGDSIVAGQVTGTFTLPDNAARPMVWIAGGVGITPFRSMALASSERIVDLFYLARNDNEFAYREVFEGVTNLHAHYLSNSSLTAQVLKKTITDYRDRIYYIAGPDAMVNAYMKLLTDLGIPRMQIKVDHFAGY